jgi:hypothetical protein
MSASGTTWGLHFDWAAVQDLYQIDRRFVRLVWAALDSLAANPDVANLQADEDDPSVYWIAIEGDVVIHFEILDSEHVIRVLKIK